MARKIRIHYQEEIQIAIWSGRTGCVGAEKNYFIRSKFLRDGSDDEVDRLLRNKFAENLLVRRDIFHNGHSLSALCVELRQQTRSLDYRQISFQRWRNDLGARAGRSRPSVQRESGKSGNRLIQPCSARNR